MCETQTQTQSYTDMQKLCMHRKHYHNIKQNSYYIKLFVHFFLQRMMQMYEIKSANTKQQSKTQSAKRRCYLQFTVKMTMKPKNLLQRNQKLRQLVYEENPLFQYKT